MYKTLSRLILAFALTATVGAAPLAAAETERSPSPAGATVGFAKLKDGDVVPPGYTLRFTISGMGVAPAGVAIDNTGHFHLLIDLETLPDMDQVLVFTRTKRGANRVAQRLLSANIGAAAIHGNKSQGARTQALAQFKLGNTCVLVATDVASRGIDVKRLSHVINFDMPATAETYTHRTGRTGRASCTGAAFTFATTDDYKMTKALERSLGKKLVYTKESGIQAPPHISSGDNKKQPSSRVGKTNRPVRGKKKSPWSQAIA